MPIIEVESLSKKYRITKNRGRYMTLRDLISNVIKHPFKFARDKVKAAAIKSDQEDFWALKDASFTVESGEAVGIIGPNGAGKSTLLKILTRITPPTEGRALLHGKVSSLLEVGTGFHLELTGRENIFLNGAILGMTNKEITKKFDNIVEFAGVQTFIDTPVKYYSSGMSVRLAFSIAAHLEPDIFLVDEVLAVGDAEFQRKCLGKMDEVTRTAGRTVLFVSHNMGAIQSLCKRCIWLDHGRIKKIGSSESVIKEYLNTTSSTKSVMEFEANSTKTMQIKKIIFAGANAKPSTELNIDEPFSVTLEYQVNEPVTGAHLGMSVYDAQHNYLYFTSDTDNNQQAMRSRTPGNYRAVFRFPVTKSLFLNKGTFYFRLTLGVPDYAAFDEVSNIKINFYDPGRNEALLKNGDRPGIFLLDAKWDTTKLS